MRAILLQYENHPPPCSAPVLRVTQRDYRSAWSAPVAPVCASHTGALEQGGWEATT
jgi:hypothetical protein